MLTTEYVDNFYSFYEDNKENFENHYTTCEAPRVGKQDLNIDKDMVQQLIDAGNMNFFILKEGDKTVGYINVSISRSYLFSKPQALIDFLYILPEYRRSNYATEAISEIEKELKSEGLKDINLCLPDKNYSEIIADKLGYSLTTTTYSKFLGE